MSTSVGAQTRDCIIFGATWESRRFFWAEWHGLALWFSFCCGHTDTHEWAESWKLQAKDQFVHDIYTQTSKPSKPSLPYSQSKCQTIHLLISPHWRHWKRSFNMWKNTGNHWMTCMDNSPVGSLILEKLTLHFSWFHVPSHKILKHCQKSCSWKWLISSMKLLWRRSSTLKLDEFYASLNAAKFPNILKMAQRTLVLGGSTYVCEQTFSAMNINKAPHRSHLSDRHLRSVLRISTTKLIPDFDALAKTGDQQHCFH